MSAGAPALVVLGDLFHNELRLRHIGSRRHDDDVELEEEEVFDAAETDGG